MRTKGNLPGPQVSRPPAAVSSPSSLQASWCTNHRLRSGSKSAQHGSALDGDPPKCWPCRLSFHGIWEHASSEARQGDEGIGEGLYNLRGCNRESASILRRSARVFDCCFCDDEVLKLTLEFRTVLHLSKLKKQRPTRNFTSTQATAEPQFSNVLADQGTVYCFGLPRQFAVSHEIRRETFPVRRPSHSLSVSCTLLE
jgi:hypothetical protein